MKEVREENEKLRRTVNILLQARGPAAKETAAGANQPRQQELEDRELRSRSFEVDPGGGSMERQLRGRSLRSWPGGSGLAGKSLLDRQGLGGDDRRLDLGTGIAIGRGVGSIIRAGGPMGGRQIYGESTQPYMLSRSERHEVNRPSTLVAKNWRTDDQYASSEDGFFLSDEEPSDIGSYSSSGGEYRPQR